MLLTGTTASLFKQYLKQKRHIDNPISKVMECGQACKTLITSFKDLSSTEGKFVCQAECQELVAKGSGDSKKEAKKAAALKLIEQAENSLEENNIQENIEAVIDSSAVNNSDTVNTSDVEQNIRHSWALCLTQLEDDLSDWVRSLAIFAFNTATGSPRYKVTQVKNENEIQAMYRVLCTWNMFFLEGEGDSRSKAEQEVAMKMMYKVRSVCGIKEVIKRTPSIEPHSVSSSINVTVPVNTQLNISSNIMSSMVKHSCLLVNNLLSGMVEQLENFCDKVASSSPVYSISGVKTSGCLVTVKVICSWLKLTSIGEGSSKTFAEQEAALKMMIQLKEIMKNGVEEPDPLEDCVNVMKADDEPVKYLVYPGHGHPLGQANVTVTSRDYQCLQTEQFLNDVIIDFYLKYLQVELFSHSRFMEKTYIFSIYFFKRLTMKPKSTSPTMSKAEGMHNNVKKWTKNVNIFENDFIVVPINDCDHWFVVIICYPALLTRQVEHDRIKQPLLLVLDSLEDGLKNSVCDHLRTYLTIEWKEKMKCSRQFTVTNMPSFCPKIPQQENLTDCGLFLLEYVESFFKEPISNFSTPLSNMSNWFTVDKVNSKREEIARLIRDLTIKQNKGMVFSFPDIKFNAGDLENIVIKKIITKEETIKPTCTTAKLNLSSTMLASSTSSPIKSLARGTIKMNLVTKPAAYISTGNQEALNRDRKNKKTELIAERKKRGAELQLGKEKKRQRNMPEEEDYQDWWCDY